MTAIPLANTLLPAKVRGVFLATVDENQDKAPENPGFRVKVTLNTVGPTVRTCWARIVVPMGGDERGTYFLPDSGEQVLVVFEHGDVNRPIVIGTAWSKKHKPPETNRSGNNNTKLIRTPKGHRIIFCDEPGKEKIIIVDRTKTNTIELDSVAQKIKIQSAGDLAIVATRDAIFHAANVKMETQGPFRGTGQVVLAHAAQKFDVCSSAPVQVSSGQIAINMDQSPACKVIGTGYGKIDGVSQAAVAKSQQAEEQNQIAAAKAAEATTAAAEKQVAAAAAVAKAAEDAKKPGGDLVGTTATLGIVGGSIGLAALGSTGIGAIGALGGAVASGAGAAAAAAAAAPDTGTVARDAAGVAPSTSPTASPSAVVATGDSAGAGGTDGPPPRLQDPQAGLGGTGDVGHDVKGRASVTADVSSTGVDISSSSSSSVFQEAAVSRATNPTQVPDVVVRATSDADRLQARGDVESAARSQVPTPPLQPTPPVIEPRTAAESTAPDSVRSAADARAQVDTATGDPRAGAMGPEQVVESIGQASIGEQIEGVHPMAVKADVNTEEGIYGDPNMLARSQLDHQVDLVEADIKLGVADEHRSTTVSVSTEEDPDPLPEPAAKLSPDPKKPQPPKPGSK